MVLGQVPRTHVSRSLVPIDLGKDKLAITYLCIHLVRVNRSGDIVLLHDNTVEIDKSFGLMNLAQSTLFFYHGFCSDRQSQARDILTTM